MKKVFLSVFLPLLFLFLQSFSVPQEPEKLDSIKGQKETEFKMTFEPARIIVDDQRTTSYIASAYEIATESNNNVAKALKEISGYMPYLIENQERRLESDMDQLSRRTGWDETRIDNAINSKRKYNFWKGASALLISGAVLSFLTFTRGELINWNHLLYKSMGAIVLGSASYYAVTEWLSTMPFMSDYIYLVNLTSLM